MLLGKSRDKEEKEESAIKSKDRKSKKIKDLVARIKKEFPGTRIMVGSEIDFLTLPRIRTGSLMLDYILGGGIPRRGITQFKGDYSVGKTTLSLHIASKVQRAGGVVAWVAGEFFSKDWAAQNGVIVDDDNEYSDLVTPLIVIDGNSGEDLLETAYRLIASNRIDLLVIDSIGSIRPTKEVDKKLGEEAQMCVHPRLIQNFVNKVTSAFNTSDSNGKSNKTAVIAINQLREQGIGSLFPRAPDSPGGRALKHTKVADVLFTKGDLIVVSGSSEKHVYGRTVHVKCTKSKICAEGREGTFDFYTQDYLHHKAGSIDTIKEARMLGMKVGLINQGGKWFYYGDMKLVGKAGIRKFFEENTVEYEKLEKALYTYFIDGKVVSKDSKKENTTEEIVEDVSENSVENEESDVQE